MSRNSHSLDIFSFFFQDSYPLRSNQNVNADTKRYHDLRRDLRLPRRSGFSDVATSCLLVAISLNRATVLPTLDLTIG